MPNHCFNTLIVSEAALPVILQNYVRKNDGGEDIFDFERVSPIGDVSDWYERRIQKWGTKWVGYDLSVGSSSMDFYTAWSPPTPLLGKLAELHKGIVFRLEYCELGMGFRGEATARRHFLTTPAGT
jgi:hypothetical protein